MNRQSKVYIGEVNDGEWWYFLSDLIPQYVDVVQCGEEYDYTIVEWTAGQMLDNNSEWKNDGPDYYHDPLTLWNWIRQEIKWQREHGVTDLESAQRVFDSGVASYTESAYGVKIT